MSAFGLNRPTRAFAKAILTAGGARLSNKNLAAIDYLVGELSGWLTPYTLSAGYAFLYPFIGGTAIAHSFNLANPATGRITWSGSGVTHDANGITGNGTAGNGDTGVALGGTNALLVSVGVYSRTTTERDSYEVANDTVSASNAVTAVACRQTVSLARFYHGAFYDGTWTVPTVSTGVAPTGAGLFSALRTTMSNFQLQVCYWQTANLVPTVVTSSSSVTVNTYNTQNFFLLSNPDGSQFSNKNLAFAYLTTPAITSINVHSRHQELGTIIQRYQARLGRAVITP